MAEKIRLEDRECPLSATLGLVGEWWTLLILHDAFDGYTRFDEFQENLGISSSLLTSRLKRLVANGLLERRQYQPHPPRYEYHLTSKGVDLWPTVVALLKWGDRHAAPAGPPVIIEHQGCGGEIDDRRRCTKCGADLEPWHATARRGPGARAADPPPVASTS